MSLPVRLTRILKTLPDKSGVYRYYDSEAEVIYVGKAKSLKKRVASYFTKEQLHPRIRMLVRRIADIQFTVVDSEYDALLLENNLIKQLQPRYNVLLKDDKTYPWICLTKEPFARLFHTRQKTNPNARYFGPYASVKMMHALLDTIFEIYRLRTCKQKLITESIQKKAYHPCLNYQINKCSGACIGKISEQEYEDNMRDVVRIIQGNTQRVIRDVKARMFACADAMLFEEAHLHKQKLILLEKYQVKSTIVSQTINNVDVFGLSLGNDGAYICYFKVINGSIIQTHTLCIKQQLDETEEEILLYAIVDVRKTFQSTAKEIIAPYNIDYPQDQVKITVAQGGEKKKLLMLAHHNAMRYMQAAQKQKELTNPELYNKLLLETMQKDLNLPAPPAYIECFDNSNLQGTFPVSAMVCFRNGKPSRKEYRTFNIKTVLDKPDDFATMEEAITRRYTRLIAENKPLPDLLIVDGGKGQVSAAYRVLQTLNIENKVPLIGIAKRLEEIYCPNDPIPLFVDKKSQTQRIIQHLRDEAHRFGISAHRKQRGKTMNQTELTRIPGIGEKIAVKLLTVFRSVNAIEEASREELQSVVGKAKAKIVFDFFHPQTE
jgi:excinuclease ABC subunit C